MKKVGKSLFLIVDDNEAIPKIAHKTSEFISRDLKEKVDLCLKHSKKKPAFRKKLAESIDELQDHLNQLRAEEGNLG